ncbi:MAG: SCO family protein [Candidatus Thermoplasmatota archaeon]|nr:SCO family protein [Candidatus Thermoplasmatota archaeon]
MRSKSLAVSILLLITALSGCIGGQTPSEYKFHGLEYDPASPAPDFTLTDQNGLDVSLSDFEGKVVVLAFTYTACPDVCLAVEANLHHVNTEMADEGDLVILSMTIDPARDTVDHLWGWTNVRGYDWPHLTSNDHSELQHVWSDYNLLVDNDHINSDHSDHGDHSDMSHQVAVLYPDNTTALLDGHHDMLPEENATGWNLTETTMTMNDVALNYSVHEQYGHSVTGINGFDTPSDWSWWWSLYIWNASSVAWEESPVGIDEVMIMQDTDHIAWVSSNANMSLLSTPGQDMHDDHEEFEVVFYHMNGCNLCESITPEWETFVEDNPDITTRKVESGESEANDMNISSYPTFLLLDDDGGIVAEFDDEHNATNFKQFYDENIEHEEHGHDGMHGDEEMYEVGHNTVTYIIDKDGNKRLVYTGPDWSTENFMEDLTQLLHHDAGADTHDDHSGHDHH